MKKIVVIQPLHRKALDLLESREDVTYELVTDLSEENLLHRVVSADAIAIRDAPISKAVLARANGLKVISRHGVGVDNIDVTAATEKGVIVATVGEANAPSVVEHTLAMMFSLAKRQTQFDHATRTGDFMIKNKLDAIAIAGRTILIIGLGRIGSRLAVVCNALGMRCIGIDPAFSAEQIRAMGCEPATNLHDVLPQADFVSPHCPLQDDTRNLIGARELALMKPTAYVINCARGGIVDEAALVAALNAGKIKGAALDVQVTEPPTPDDPLLKSDRIILTPHSAATTAACVARSSTNVAHNIVNYFDGKLPPSHIFNPEALKR